MRTVVQPTHRAPRTVSLVPNYVVLSAFLLFALMPLFVLFSNSFKSQTEIASNPFGLPTSGFYPENYVNAWNNGHYSVTLRNSLVICIGTIIGVLLVAGSGAYSLARLDLKGANLLVFYLIVTTSMPVQLFMVPVFFLWRQLGLVDNLFGLVIIYCATQSPFATFLLRSFMIAIPRELDEAALVDGANEWQAFWQVIVPVTWPGFLTTGLVVGLATWNEFLWSFTFLHNPDLKTVAASLFGFFGRFDRDWGQTSAASVLMILPMILLFLLLQRRFIHGLTQGSLKG